MKEKTFPEISKELANYKALKSADQEKEAKQCEERLRSTIREIASNSSKVKQAEIRLQEAECKHEAIKKEVGEEREKRQSSIAMGTDPSTFTASLQNLKAEEELLEDTRVGLQKRIENLISEGELLEQEKTEIERTLLRYKLVPLVAEWNEMAEKLAGILKEIIIIAEQSGEDFGRYRGIAATVFYSSFEGIENIARMYMADEVTDNSNKLLNGRLRGVFNFQDFQGERRALREKAVILQEEKNKAVIA